VQILSRLVNLDEILYGGDGIEYCLGNMLQPFKNGGRLNF
jgi:hypothetical protein